jgi:hypothetical protein
LSGRTDFDKAVASYSKMVDMELELVFKQMELDSVDRRIAYLEVMNGDRDDLHRARKKRTAVDAELRNVFKRLGEARKQSMADRLRYAYEEIDDE